MELRDYVHAVRRYWKMTIVVVLVCVEAAAILTLRADRIYESTITFFASASVESDDSALEDDEFTQRRVASYVGVVESELMAERVLESTGLEDEMDVRTLLQRVSATAGTETVLLDVTVVDTSDARSLQIAEAIVAELDGVVEDLDATDGQSEVDFTPISGPTLNPDPVSPRRTLNLAVGLLVGLALGIGLALVRQRLDTRVQTSDEVRELSGLPLVGLVARDGRDHSPLGGADTASPRAEAVRHLRTNLRFVGGDGPLRTLAVVSPGGGEGRTTTAIDLATSLAVDGQRVLLVDADLRSGTASTLLESRRRGGLSTVLAGDDDATAVVVRVGSRGFDLLPSGPLPPNPSELLGRPELGTALQRLSAAYDIVVVDTPALLPSTDGKLAASAVDAVVLLVAYSRTRRPDLQAALVELESVRAHPVGVLITRVPKRWVQRPDVADRPASPAAYSDPDPSDGTDEPSGDSAAAASRRDPGRAAGRSAGRRR